ncbi:F0F1 ATP synthase subunit delta [Massilibacterium senegalense]|uniref:F0F1 ATP synthase subunit delta n=1 Tax=Massilibacterium senegalense TaxID=1632858 RepID=UPI00078026DD|nr:F0F1 ATP synthase subunit delta [Massilibacterium senegalense]
MSKTVVASRYAGALFELAKEQGKIDGIEGELRTVETVLGQTPNFFTVVNHPKITKENKKKLIKDTFGTSVSSYVLNLLFVLVDSHRIGIVKEVIASFYELANEERSIAEAYVYTVSPLTEEQTNTLRAMLSKRLDKKSVRIHNEVDKSIVGGVKIRVGNRILDGTVSTKLKRLERQLVSN